MYINEKKHLQLIDKKVRKSEDKKFTAEKKQGTINHQQDKLASSVKDTKPENYATASFQY